MGGMDVFLRTQLAAMNTAYASGGPTPAQAEAENYKKGRVTISGLPIAIECPRGSYRCGCDANGKEWRSLMPAHYGHFAGRDHQKGADGDGVDVFVGPIPGAKQVWVINQTNADGSFDESKVLLGFPSEDAAKAAYFGSYERGWDRVSSIVPCTVDQLTWWLKYGATTKPMQAKSLPFDGDDMSNAIVWDSAANPVGTDLAGLIYQIRREDTDSLMLDAVTVADILADSDGELALDALVIPFNQLERKMTQMQAVMNAAGDSVKPVAMQVTPPFKQRGTTNVAAVFELSDGQSVSIFFHNPDTTPNKITPGDEMVSWKWMLNRKDVTILVAPEQGRDLNVREVSRRVMRLAEKNSARFQAANAKKSERMAGIESLKQSVEAKEAALGELQAEVADLTVKVEAKRAASPASLQGQDTGVAATKDDKPATVEGQGVTATLIWSEGSPDENIQFSSFEELEAWFKRTFSPEKMAANKEKGWQYSKNKVSVRVPGQGEIISRIDVSDNEGDFNPNKQSLGEYMREAGHAVPEAAAASKPEPHKSELILAALVSSLGWSEGVAGEVKKTISGFGYSARFDNRARYLSLFSDNDPDSGVIVDIDTRGLEPMEAAQTFNALATQKADARATAPQDIDPTSPEGYALVMQDEKLQLYWQDRLDSFFGSRIVDVRNALRDLGWEGAKYKALSKSGFALKPVYKQVGAGANIVGMHYEIEGVPGYFMSDDLTRSPQELAEKINMGIPNASGAGAVAITNIIGRDAVVIGKKRYEKGANGYWTIGRNSQPLTAEILKADGASFELDDFDKLRQLGTATVSSVGSENVYFVKDGVPYYTKALNTDSYTAGQVVDLSELAEPAEVSVPANPRGLSDAQMVVLLASAGFKSAFRLENAMRYAGISESQYKAAADELNADGRYLKRSAITDAGRDLAASFLPEVKFADGKLRAFNGKFAGDAAQAGEEQRGTIFGVSAILKSMGWVDRGSMTWDRGGHHVAADKGEMIVSAYNEGELVEIGRVSLASGDDGGIAHQIEKLVETERDRAADELARAEQDAEQAAYSKFNRASVKMPTAVGLMLNNKNLPALVNYKGQDGWTNGHMLALHKPKLLTDAIAKYHVDEQNLRKLSEDAVARVIPRDATVPVQPVAQYDSHNETLSALAAMRGDTKNFVKRTKVNAVILANEQEGVATAVDAKYFGYFDKQFKQPGYFVAKDGTGTVLVKKAGEVVGVMMPINMKEPNMLKRAAKAAQAEAAPAPATATAPAADSGNAELIAAGFKQVGGNDYVMVAQAGDKKLQYNVRSTSSRFRGSLTIGFAGGFTGAKIELGSSEDAATMIGVIQRDAERRAAEEAGAAGTVEPTQAANEDTALTEAKALLQSVIDGSADMFDPELADQLTKVHEDFTDDTVVMDLFEKAAQAYSDFMVGEARKALA